MDPTLQKEGYDQNEMQPPIFSLKIHKSKLLFERPKYLEYSCFILVMYIEDKRFFMNLSFSNTPIRMFFGKLFLRF